MSRKDDAPPAAAAVSLEEVAVVFDALAHEARRHIIVLLSQLGDELPSGYLAARFQHSWPTTCRHLKVLEDAGLVEVRRERRSSLYRLNRERLERVVGGWLRSTRPVGPDRKWTSTGPKSTTELAARSAPNAIEPGSPERNTSQETRRKKRG